MITSQKLIPLNLKIDGLSASDSGQYALINSGGQFHKLLLENNSIEALSIGEPLNFAKSFKLITEDKLLLGTSAAIYFAKIDGLNINIEQKFEVKSDGYRPIIDSTSDGNSLVYGIENLLITIVNGQMIRSSVESEKIWNVTISADGKYVAIAMESGKVEIRNCADLTIVKEFQLEHMGITLSFSPDNKYLVCGDDYAKISSFDIENGEKFDYLNPYSKKPVYIGWADNNTFIISHLSSIISKYTLNVAEGIATPLADFNTRYFQHGVLMGTNRLILSVEDLRNAGAAVEGVPQSYLVAVLELGL